MGRTAHAWAEPMRRLGYERYGLHVVTDPLTAAATATFLPGMAGRLDGSGRHFPAMEAPAQLVADLQAFFGPLQ